MTNYFLETRSYTDVIHTTIPYSGLENYILNTPLLLRLHRVSQNSLVYLTFPTNKIKRFEHSLGVMHLAGKLFYSGVANTKVETLNKMFDKFGKELDEWIKPGNKKKEKAEAYGSDFIKRNKNFIIKDRMFSFVGPYNAYTPPHIPQQWSMLYISLFQGVRIAGLLHDIGHLPYSHTLEKVLEILRDRWEIHSKKNKIQEEYIKLVDAYKDNNFEKLHEAISLKLLPVVESECMDSILKELNKQEKDKQITEDQRNNYLTLCLYSFEIAKRILTRVDNDSVIFNVLHKIISGTLDADRLDYVSRDLFCSGVSTDIINYERMFMFLSFEEVIDNDSDNIFPLTILPKTVGDVEEYLRKRWKIYRDINYHHSVHKSEMLMRSILIKAAENSQKNILINNMENIEGEYDLPNDFFQGIFYVLKKLYENANNKEIANTFLKLDDSWLDTVLKKTENINEMVDELVFGRKSYQTIIKRYDDYFEIVDKKVYHLFIKDSNKDISLFSNLDDELNRLFDEMYNNNSFHNIEFFEKRLRCVQDVLLFVQDTISTDHSDFVSSDNSFFINYIVNLLNIYFKNTNPILDNHYYRNKFLHKLEFEIYKRCKYTEEANIIMIGSIYLNQCLEDDCIIRVNNKHKPLSSYSGIENYLHTESLLLPLFHFYCKIELVENGKINKLIGILTKTIFEILKDDIIKCGNELIKEMKDTIICK